MGKRRSRLEYMRQWRRDLNRIWHRCSRESCKLRVTFSKHWENFIRPKKCCGCGGTRFRVDKWAMKASKKNKCNCGGYHFPHRKGSKYCYENPQAEKHWTDRMSGK